MGRRFGEGLLLFVGSKVESINILGLEPVATGGRTLDEDGDEQTDGEWAEDRGRSAAFILTPGIAGIEKLTVFADEGRGPAEGEDGKEFGC